MQSTPSAGNRFVVADKLKAAGISEILLKPIARQDLAHTLRKVLDSG